MATPHTLNQLYFGALETFSGRPVAMRRKRGGRWVDLSYGEVASQVRDLSIGLLELGVRPGDRVAALCFAGGPPCRRRPLPLAKRGYSKNSLLMRM